MNAFEIGGKAQWRGCQVLITGGLGFIGSNLARTLVDLGAVVTLVDSLVPEYGGNLFNIQSIKGSVHVNISDVRDEFSLRQLVQKKNVLFNLAGQTSHMDSMSDPVTDLDINCRAQLSILEACRQVNQDIRIVFASTRQIYGKPDYLPVDEKHPIRPVDVNGVNKMAGEAYHILYNNVYGISACALRLTNTYGPRMRVKDARQTFLGVWIKQVLQGEPIEVWDGSQLRDFTYVEDCVEALLNCASEENTKGRVFNLGGAEAPIALKDLADLLIEINGSGRLEVRQFPQERKPIDVGDYYADASSISRVTGWVPNTTLREGLTETLEFYRANLDHYL